MTMPDPLAVPPSGHRVSSTSRQGDPAEIFTRESSERAAEGSPSALRTPMLSRCLAKERLEGALARGLLSRTGVFFSPRGQVCPGAATGEEGTASRGVLFNPGGREGMKPG